MGNPLLTLDAKDALVISLGAYAATTAILIAVGLILWCLSHFGVWR